MSYVPVFTDMMAQALASTPTAEAALSIWSAMDELAPTVGQVLHYAIPTGNMAAFHACRQRLGDGTMTPADQGRALSGWRKSGNDKPAAMTETQIMAYLLDLGLIDGRAMVEVRGNPGHKRGPGAHLLACLRFDGFEVLLDRVVLTQGDLDQCLHQLIGRASSGGQRERWLKLVDRLLEAGANPRAKVDCHQLNLTLQQNTFQTVLSLASCWRDLPIEQQGRLLGQETLAQWTQPSTTGHCPMVAWLQHGGDLGAACAWAQGKTIEPVVLTRLLSVLLVRDQQEGGRGQVLDALWTLDGLPAVSCEHMVELAHSVLRTAVSLHGSGDGVEPEDIQGWWADRARRLLSLAEPAHQATAGHLLETAGRWLEQALGPGAGVDMDEMRQQLEHIHQTMQLEVRTEGAAGLRFGKRL